MNKYDKISAIEELEDLRGIACVGISNWALDAAPRHIVGRVQSSSGEH